MSNDDAWRPHVGFTFEGARKAGAMNKGDATCI